MQVSERKLPLLPPPHTHTRPIPSLPHCSPNQDSALLSCSSPQSYLEGWQGSLTTSRTTPPFSRIRGGCPGCRALMPSSGHRGSCVPWELQPSSPGCPSSPLTGGSMPVGRFTPHLPRFTVKRKGDHGTLPSSCVPMVCPTLTARGNRGFPDHPSIHML